MLIKYTLVLFFASNYNGKLVTSLDTVGEFTKISECENTAFELSKNNKFIKEVKCIILEKEVK